MQGRTLLASALIILASLVSCKKENNNPTHVPLVTALINGLTGNYTGHTVTITGALTYNGGWNSDTTYSVDSVSITNGGDSTILVHWDNDGVCALNYNGVQDSMDEFISAQNTACFPDNELFLSRTDKDTLQIIAGNRTIEFSYQMLWTGTKVR